MKHLLRSSTAIISSLALGCAPAYAWNHHGKRLLTCNLFSTGAVDGCLGAPAPLTAQFYQPAGFQPGGYINTTAATTANYMNTNCGPSANQPCRPQYHVAGFDYAIGNYHLSGDPVLQDPATMSLAGCSYSLTLSGTGAGLLTCGNSGYLGLLQHVELGPIGGHGCTALRMNGSSAATTYTFDDIHFFNDSGKCAVNTTGNDPFPLWSPLITQNIVATNIFMDGNARTFATEQGGCATLLCNPGDAWGLNTTGTVSVKYVVFKNFAGRTLNMPGNSPSVSIQYSYIEGWLALALWGHGEWYLGGGASQGVGSLTLSYMSAVDRWDVQQQGEAPIFPATNFPNATGSLDIDHFVNINSHVGKASKTGSFQGCIGATFSGSTCSGAGNKFFITSVTGTIGYGLAVGAYGASGCNTSGAVYYLDTDLGAGSGYVDSWTLDSGNTPASLLSVGPFNGCPSNAFNNQIANIGFLALGGAPLGTSTIHDNYMDVSSLAGAPASPNIYSTGVGIAVTNVTGTVSGITLTLSAAATIVVQSSANGTGITGCSSGILSCPVTTTPTSSGTVFTLNTSGGSVGPIPIAMTQQIFCNTPTSFFNNIDMTGTPATQAVVNGWTQNPAIGC